MSKAPTILLLQGPLGPFFADLAAAFQAHDCRVWRITFNAGDRHFAGQDTTDTEMAYHGDPADWPAHIKDFLQEKAIDCVIVYGDMRFYHRQTKPLCEALGVAFWCLEEGYIRPGFITCEPGGNNANSLYPALFNGQAGAENARPVVPPKRADHGPTIRSQIWFGILYYVMSALRLSGYERYQHHRTGSSFSEQRAWILAGFRKVYHAFWRDRGRTDDLIKRYDGRIILVPLQVAVDSQILYHSPYDGVLDFLQDVFSAAQKHMDPRDHLVIKHHPMERGHHHYGAVIKRLSRQFGLVGRVTYVFDLDLDRLIPHCKRCITINSTLSNNTLLAGIPTAILGNAMIKDAGFAAGALTEDFWQSDVPVQKARVQSFLDGLKAYALLPGSFYRYRYVAAHSIAEKIRDSFKANRAR